MTGNVSKSKHPIIDEKLREAENYAKTAKDAADELNGLTEEVEEVISVAVTAQEAAERAATRAEELALSFDAQNLVHQTWDETIGGVKTFTDGVKTSLIQTPGDFDGIDIDAKGSFIDIQTTDDYIHIGNNHGSIHLCQDADDYGGIAVNATKGDVRVTTEGGFYYNGKEVATKDSFMYYGEAGVVPSSQELFCFDTDDSTQTASVTFTPNELGEPGDSTLSGDIVVPYEYETDGVVYRVTGIGDYAFSGGAGIKSICIPNTVKSIGEYAFYGCSSITKIILPDGLRSIPNRAFLGCSKLPNIDVPDSVTDISYFAFENCSSLKSIKLPNSLITIDDWAFSGCSALEKVIIPEGVTALGEESFYGCSNLTRAEIPSSVETFRYGVFSNCPSLKIVCEQNSYAAFYAKECGIPCVYDVLSDFDIIITKDIVALSCKYYEDAGVVPSSQNLFNFEINKTAKTATVTGTPDIAGDIVIPYEYKIAEGSDAGVYKVTEIGYDAFYDNKGITSVYIPSTVTHVGETAFYCCSNLASVHISKGVVRFSDRAFASCTSLTEIVIPNSAEVIGTFVFSGCTNLKNVTLSENLTTIDDFAFWGCESLTKIVIPDRVTTIGEDAFYKNTNLISAIIPKSVTTMRWDAFSSCPNLRIICEQNSQAETYAKDNGIPYAYNVITGASPVKGVSPLKASVNISGGAQSWTLENVEDASGNVIGTRYGQKVTVNNATITPYSKVDLQLTSEQTAILYGKGLAFVAENDGGVVTVYCIGNIPEDNYTFQAVVTEVVVND